MSNPLMSIGAMNIATMNIIVMDIIIAMSTAVMSITVIGIIIAMNIVAIAVHSLARNVINTVTQHRYSNRTLCAHRNVEGCSVLFCSYPAAYWQY